MSRSDTVDFMDSEVPCAKEGAAPIFPLAFLGSWKDKMSEPMASDSAMKVLYRLDSDMSRSTGGAHNRIDKKRTEQKDPQAPSPPFGPGR
mmetsp:Transcript_36614/g.49043  ORF Transcript_36614/g.49043 Transcript_36614/m.49043 type:complete len:90 (-) Transcript_36614:136-405(-)